MKGFFSVKLFLRLLAAAVVLAAVIVLVAERMENSRVPDAIAQKEVTRIVRIQETVVVTQLVWQVITTTPLATLEATPTTTLTHTPYPTPTPELLSVLPDGVTIGCLPITTRIDSAVIPVTGGVPEDAIIAEKIEGVTTVFTQVKNCTFTFTFNKAVDGEFRLQFQDLNPEPFLEVALAPLGDQSHSAYADITHFWIVDPPSWHVSYTLRVLDQDGEIIWEDQVVFKRRYQPNPCPDGRLPDPVSLICSDLSH